MNPCKRVRKGEERRKSVDRAEVMKDGDIDILRITRHWNTECSRPSIP